MSMRLGDGSSKLADLRDLRTARGRREQGAFAVEGPTLLAEALAAGLRPREIYHDARMPPCDPRLDGTPTYALSERGLARCSDLETPPGTIAVFDLPAPAPDFFAAGAPVLAIGVNDPGNAGTLVRTAEIFGVARIVFIAGAVDPYAPKVVRATMGAIFRTEIARLSGMELTAAAKAAGYAVVGATREGEALDRFVFPERAVIAIGSERAGLAERLPQRDRDVRIPHVGGGESLNAAVAGGIMLYAFSRSRAPGFEGGECQDLA